MSSISSVSKILFTVINDYFTKTKDINSVLSFYNRDSTIIFNDLNEKKTEKFENMTQIENFLENLLKKDIHISNSSIQSIPGTDLFIIFTFVGDASGRKLHSTLYLELDTETNKDIVVSELKHICGFHPIFILVQVKDGWVTMKSVLIVPFFYQN